MAGAVSNKILAAGVLGFALGILYAPRKGTETQAKLKAHIDDMKSDMESKAKRAKSKISEMKKDKGGPMLDKAQQEIEDMKERAVP